MNKFLCGAILLAVLVAGARVDDDVEDTAFTAPHKKRKKQPQEEAAPQEEDQEEVEEASTGQAQAAEQSDVEEDEVSPTPLQLAVSAHKKSQEEHKDAIAANSAAHEKHLQATLNEDMSSALSLVKKSAAKAQGDRAQAAQEVQTSATQQRQTAAEKKDSATIHHEDATRMAAESKEEAVEAKAIVEKADKRLEQARLSARIRSDEYDTAEKDAADGADTNKFAFDKASKARQLKVESAEQRDASEKEKIDLTAEAHEKAAAAVHAVHEHAMAQDHLSQMKRLAVQAKIDLKVAVRQRKDAEAAACKAAKDTDEADEQAEHSAWAAHGMEDRVGSDTAAAMSAFSYQTDSHEEAEHRVASHKHAQIVKASASAALHAGTKENEEAVAEVEESEPPLEEVPEELVDEATE